MQYMPKIQRWLGKAIWVIFLVTRLSCWSPVSKLATGVLYSERGVCNLCIVPKRNWEVRPVSRRFVFGVAGKHTAYVKVMVMNVTETSPGETSSKTLLSYQECSELRISNYCEENAWHILKLAYSRRIPAEHLYAIFISNATRCVPFQKQRAASIELGNVCFWDYHVIAATVDKSKDAGGGVHIYDIDSTLPFPCSLETYVRESIVKTLPNGVDYAELSAMGFSHQCRLVNYRDLVNMFSSDRRHMLATEDTCTEGSNPEYKSPPPKRPCITAAALPHPHTLPLFLRISGSSPNDAFAVPDSLADVEAPGMLFETVTELCNFFIACGAIVDWRRE